jgi:tetratricopeptide (TPR) repeat protein
MNSFSSVSLCLCGLLSFSACSAGPQARTDAAKTFVAEGREAEKRGDHAGAVTLYTRAIDADPKYADAYVERGYSNIRLRLHSDTPGHARDYEDRAIGDYSEAIGLDPTRGDAYYNRAMLYTSRALYRQAAEDLLNAIKCKSQDPEPHLDLARIYESKFEDMGMKAGEHYEKYADLGGRDPEARERAKQFKEFRKHLQGGPSPAKPTTEEDEKKAQELHARAMSLMREDKKEEAVKLVEELLTAYGRTRYVQDPQRLAGLKALLGAFKKEPPK